MVGAWSENTLLDMVLTRVILVLGFCPTRMFMNLILILLQPCRLFFKGIYYFLTKKRKRYLLFIVISSKLVFFF